MDGYKIANCPLCDKSYIRTKWLVKHMNKYGILGKGKLTIVHGVLHEQQKLVKYIGNEEEISINP